MTSTITALLGSADQHWSEGMLADSQARYREVLEQDADSWPAAFQLAWIDAAFVSLHPDRIRALDRPGLSAEARRLLARLGTRTRLPEDLARWDLPALRRAPDASQPAWWMTQAQRVADAGQYGLALACYGEAEHLAPALFYDPPSAFQVLPLQIESHLRAVRQAVVPRSAP